MGILNSYARRLKLSALTLGALKHPNARIEKLSHRFLTYEDFRFHRVVARGKRERVSGVGVSEDLLTAQATAIMECLERDHYYANPKRPTTNGMSCSTKKVQARLASLLELVERDQLLLTIFYSPTWKVLAPQTRPSITYFYMTHDLPIHVVMAEIKWGVEERCYGFGCSFDIIRAKDKALREAILLYDSRSVPVPVPEIRGNVWHMLPFINPSAASPQLPPCDPRQRTMEPVAENSLLQCSLPELQRAMDEKGLDVTYEYSEHKVFPFLSLVICQAISSTMQDLFFSDSQIQINALRTEGLGYSSNPRYSVLHPIG